MKDWFSKAKVFLSEVASEVRKVSFPSREELIGTTTVVLVTSIVFAIYLWVTDQVIGKLLFGVFGQ